MKKEELLYEKSFNVEFYEGLCIGILRSHSFHSMRERTHENRGSSQEIESNQVFHKQWKRRLKDCKLPNSTFKILKNL